LLFESGNDRIELPSASQPDCYPVSTFDNMMAGHDQAKVGIG